MNSMYETIMSLPLFYGISTEHVSHFVGRTHLRFNNYKKGERIINAGETQDELSIILSGRAIISHINATGSIALEEVCGSGKVLGAERLFGLYKENPFTAIALEPTGVMSFSKEEYVTLLHNEPIYMMNYLNYLAVRAQRAQQLLINKTTSTIVDYIAKLLMNFTDPRGFSYRLRSSLKALSEVTNISENKILKQLYELNEKGLIRYEGEVIEVVERDKLIEMAMGK